MPIIKCNRIWSAIFCRKQEEECEIWLRRKTAVRGSVDEVFSGHVKHKDMAFMSPIISCSLLYWIRGWLIIVPYHFFIPSLSSINILCCLIECCRDFWRLKDIQKTQKASINKISKLSPCNRELPYYVSEAIGLDSSRVTDSFGAFVLFVHRATRSDRNIGFEAEQNNNSDGVNLIGKKSKDIFVFSLIIIMLCNIIILLPFFCRVSRYHH